jgi:hypothetical protein
MPGAKANAMKTPGGLRQINVFPYAAMESNFPYSSAAFF